MANMYLNNFIDKRTSILIFLLIFSFSGVFFADNNSPGQKKVRKNTSSSTVDTILEVLYFPVKLFLPHYEERDVLYNIETQYHWISVEQDSKGQRHLVFNPHKGSQSVWYPDNPEKIYSNYLKTMLLALVCEKKTPEKMLFLGLGGGIMPRHLREFYPDTKFDIVELDKTIPGIAEEYFGFKKDEKMNIIIEDGRYYVNRCKEKYDYIFLDIYNAKGIPFEFTTQEFFLQLKKLLAQDGILSLNIANLGKENFIQNEIKTIKSVFPNMTVFVCVNQTNYVVVASENANFAEKDFMEKVKMLETKRDFGYAYASYAETMLSPEDIKKMTDDKEIVILTDDFAPETP